MAQLESHAANEITEILLTAGSFFVLPCHQGAVKIKIL